MLGQSAVQPLGRARAQANIHSIQSIAILSASFIIRLDVARVTGLMSRVITFAVARASPVVRHMPVVHASAVVRGLGSCRASPGRLPRALPD